MLAVDVAAIWLINRRKPFWVWVAAMVCVGATAILLGGVLAGLFAGRLGSLQGWDGVNRYGILSLWSQGSHFAIFRLWSYGLFVHGVVLLVGTAAVWRRSRAKLAGVAAVVAIALACTGLEAFVIEPQWLEVSHYRIASPKIHQPLRIVVVADLQTDRIGAYERGVLRQVLEQKPDLILLAGDYIQTSWEDRAILQSQLNRVLRELDFTAPRGVFAVQGNVDCPGWQEIFDGLGVTTVSANESFDLGELRLTCLGLFESLGGGGRIVNPRPDQFHLVLGHAPDYALGQVDAELLVAGHTHGGQVRLPWIGPVITHSRVPHDWAAGMTDLPGGRKLLVSRGIGMERGNAPPVRFLCRPELVVIDLVHSEAGKREEGRGDEHL